MRSTAAAAIMVVAVASRAEAARQVVKAGIVVSVWRFTSMQCARGSVEFERLSVGGATQVIL